MKTDPEIAASINSDFAKAILGRAADILAAGQPETEAATAYDALEKARNEFLVQESQGQRKQRTYGFRNLLVDLGSLIRQRYPQYADGYAPINQWSRETDRETVVKTIREAATPISNIVAERTRTATKFELMSEKERVEYLVMQKAMALLQQQGLAVQVEWDREDPEKDPIDYWATIDERQWAFEITELRKDARGSHPKVGDPRSTKSLTEELSCRIPRVPDGPAELQTALNKAIDHGNQEGKLDALGKAKYCLVIHNQQFLYEPSWKEVTYPDLRALDVVLIVHTDDLTPAQVWEVVPNNGFGKPIRSQNISDLADMGEFRASHRKPVDREALRAAREAIPELDEAEILRAIKDLSGC